MDAAGVMADSDANTCMTDSEMNLGDCHDIRPVAVGLVLAPDDTPVMHVCRMMGYMIMVREDGAVHRQPLVNAQATDCIMSPDAIIHQTLDCMSWRVRKDTLATPEVHLCSSTTEDGGCCI